MQTARLRFAVVAPYLPAPEDSGGRIRIAALSRGLARRGDVDLYTRGFTAEFDGPARSRRSALGPYREVHVFARDLPSGVPGWDPWRARDATPVGLLVALRARHHSRPYDAVLACHAYAASALRFAPGALWVLDEHNLESRYARDVLHATALEGWAMARFERAAWRDAALISCVRGDDADEIRRWARGEVCVIPNGARVRDARWRPPSARTGRAVIFVGAMSHPPNVEACERLAREVLPRLRAVEPEARLVLCGRAPSERVRALAGPAVTVTGTVDDPAPWLYDASVFACALPGGEGTSLKVLEAAAVGLPIVSTPPGLRALPLRAGTHASVASDVAGLAAAILEAWRRPDLADARAVAARDAIATMDWDTLADEFARRVCERLAARRGPT